MTLLSLPYVNRFYDRHGRLRFYFRRRGTRRPLLGIPGSSEFMAAYQAALDETKETKVAPIDKASTIAQLAASWRASAANRLLSVLHLMMIHAIREQVRDDDPTTHIQRVRYDKKGFATWTEADIAAFEEKWPLGTRTRLALALLLYTAQRRSDVICMGPQNVQGDTIAVVQQKTKESLLLPMHPELSTAIRACGLTGNTTFLITQKGDPFASGNVFYNWFVDCSRAAGVTKSPHGLRKAAARRVAEGGGTPHHVKSVTGHRTLSEVQRYTDAVQQENMARTAVGLMSGKPKPQK